VSLHKGEQRQGALAPQLPRTTRNSIPEVSGLRVNGRLPRLLVRCNYVSNDAAENAEKTRFLSKSADR